MASPAPCSLAKVATSLKNDITAWPPSRGNLRPRSSSAHLLVQTRKAKSLAAARKQAADCLNSSAPRKKWDEMLVAQGADLGAFNKKLALDRKSTRLNSSH